MNQEFLVIIGLAVLFSIIVITTIVRDNNTKKKWLRNKIKENWGQASDREYTYEEFASIGNYARRHEGDDFMIDDITWNDLDMDRIFMVMNQTMSSCGEDYLYYLLRKPEFSKEALDERNRLVEFFREEEGKRVEMQMTLATIGKTVGMSISDYINRLSDVERSDSKKHIVCCAAAVAAIVSIFIQPVFGILALLVVGGINFYLYFQKKGKIEVYLRCFQCVLKLLAASDSLSELKNDEISEYTEKIKVAKDNMKSFRRGAFLVTTAGTVSQSIADSILDFAKMLFHVDLIKFNSMLYELDVHVEDVECLIEQIGILDSAIAIASYREYLPYYCRGNFGQQSKKIELKVDKLYHPLIENPVANSIVVRKGTLITGSNASGKSTFLKNIAIGSILAQTIDTCPAKCYEAPFLKVMTSMALKDDLAAGESYYMVEIKSLKRILVEAEKKEPVLCIVDEVLRGTNTIERIAASSRILKSLAVDNVLPFAATHDIELSYILEDNYENYHFEEEIKEHDVHFNYILKTGRTQTRNAIRLLELVGFPSQIVKDASDAAKDFEKKGIWEKVSAN